jgi:hypothetical protein
MEDADIWITDDTHREFGPHRNPKYLPIYLRGLVRGHQSTLQQPLLAF